MKVEIQVGLSIESAAAMSLEAEMMSSQGRKNRQKGDRFERAVVKRFRDGALDAERVPLSGSAGGSFGGDIHLQLGDRKFVIEAKARANGFVLFYEWLTDRHAVIVKADRKEPLVVLRLDDFIGLVKDTASAPHVTASGTTRRGGSAGP